MSGRGELGESRCREILEVGPEAGREEIRASYLLLKSLYAPGSTGGLPSMDEFSPQAQAGILAEIEEAYGELSGRRETVAPAPAPVPVPALAPGEILDGPGLGRIRAAAGFTLEQMGAETSVRPTYLAALEEERFLDLPSAAVIVRGYLTAYLAALGVASDASVASYVQRFQRWQAKG